MSEAAHDWVKANAVVRWPHCGVCGVIQRRDGLNSTRCRGPVKVGLRPMRGGGNYTTDDDTYPQRVTFADGRVVSIAREGNKVFLAVGLEPA